MYKKSKLVVFPLIVLLTACSPLQSEIVISENEYGSDWPFKVSDGKLMCIGNAVIFKTDKNEYAINGVAKQEGYTAIEPIWKEDPAFYQMAEQLAISEGKTVKEVINLMGTPTRINIGVIVERGLTLCK